MIKPPVPSNEKARLHELKRFNILDTLPEQVYDDLVFVAAQICETPISSLTLVDENRQWFKATRGMGDGKETHRDSSFCAHAIVNPNELMIVMDATKDQRFFDNPSVTGEPNVRFYAGAPLVTSDGVPLGALCVVDTVPREISEAQKNCLLVLARQVMRIMEARLANEESQLESIRMNTLVSSMTSGILALSTDLTVTDVNTNFCKMFGFSEGPSALKGLPLSEALVGFADRFFREPEKEMERFQQLLAKPELVLSEEISLKDGRTIERDFVPVYFQENFVANLWIHRDITHKKLQEATLDSALKKAQTATQIKDEFLANMSHEIRTPLNGIIGLSGLLLESQLDTEQKDLAENVKQAGESLLEIVNDILDYSKIEAQKLELEEEPFSLHECLEQSLYLLDYRASQKGINLGYMVNSRLPALVRGDSGRVKQVLINLIGNAVKFTSVGGIVVSVSHKKLTADSSQVQFSVKDSGIGIPKDRMNQLFQSFSQVDASTSRKYGGTGLGLAISRRLCKMMGGDIWVESELGQGSTFHFTILVKNVDANAALPVPMAEKKAAHPYPKEAHVVTSVVANSPSKDTMAVKILVVEDNAVNLKLTLNLLKKFGYTADVAGNGIEAVQAVEKFHYDLIFMDLQMPEMSGLEATVKIRQMTLPKGQPKIVALTANAMKEDQERCMTAGMDDYLSKPVRPQLLLEMIQRWSGQEVTATAGAEAPAGKQEFDTLIQQILVKNFLGDYSVFETVAKMVLADKENLLTPLKSAIVKQDRALLKETAHKLKGSVSYFHIKECLQLADDLEHQAASISFADAERCFRDLEKYVAQLIADLTVMLQTPSRKSA